MTSRPFSKKWMLISMAVFIASELLIGGLVGSLMRGYTSISLRFLMQGLLNLGSYFVGGVIIGVISPGVRIYEPAAGAFLSVALMMSLTLFTPFSFIAFSLTKLLVGGAIAFALGLAGAKLGERLMGNRILDE